MSYMNLAPLSIEKKIELAEAACNFFSPTNATNAREMIGLKPTNPIRPFEVKDFLTYLEKTSILEKAFPYIFSIRSLLQSLETAGLLTTIGHGNFVIAPNAYYSLRQLTTIESKGNFWLSPALGPEFIIHKYRGSIVHLLGLTSDGSEHAGTGLLLDNRTILTCAHVINDMTLHNSQVIQGAQRIIESAVAHPTIDVGIVQLADGISEIDQAIAFKDPGFVEEVFTIGFPRIPLSSQPTLVTQRGEVVAENFKTILKQDVFLYSAISRPGNSGGPIISRSGHVTGIVTHDISFKDQDDAPFYAGIPTGIIVTALKAIAPHVRLQIEDYN